jgi:hypothetical protein
VEDCVVQGLPESLPEREYTRLCEQKYGRLPHCHCRATSYTKAGFPATPGLEIGWTTVLQVAVRLCALPSTASSLRPAPWLRWIAGWAVSSCVYHRPLDAVTAVAA